MSPLRIPCGCGEEESGSGEGRRERVPFPRKSLLGTLYPRVWVGRHRVERTGTDPIRFTSRPLATGTLRRFSELSNLNVSVYGVHRRTLYSPDGKHSTQFGVYSPLFERGKVSQDLVVLVILTSYPCRSRWFDLGRTCHLT